MRGPSPLRQKAYAFALQIVAFSEKLNQEKHYVISKQLLKCGTSIAANLEEAVHAQSTPDYISKFSISHKESGEADFWLRLLRDSHIFNERAEALRQELTPIRKMLTSSLNTLKKK